MKYIVVAIGLVAIHIAILTQLRFEVWPEMLVIPHLQQSGFELYRDMIVPWTPGLMWILHGWFNLVGLSVGRLKLLTWILIAGIDFLVFLIAKKKWGEKAGLAALLFFILLQPVFDGNGLWFDLAVVPFLLAAFYWRQPLLLGPAFLIKQSVVWLVPLFVVKRKDLILTLAGLVSVIGLSLLWFWSRGTLGDYWYWVYEFAFLKFPSMPGHKDLGNWRLWALAAVPFVLVGGMKGITRLRQKTTAWQGGIRRIAEDPLWWAVFSIPFALPRFGLFHFQPAVAFAALALGRSVAGLQRGKPTIAFLSLAAGEMYKNYKDYKYKIFVLIGVIYLSFVWQRTLAFQWQKPDRFLEPEVYQLAAEVALTTRKDEPVLLMNSPELVYVLADRLPPKPWLTQFPWFLELPGFQEALVEKFKRQNLHQVIVEPYKNEGEFVPGSYRPKILLDYVNAVIASD